MAESYFSRTIYTKNDTETGDDTFVFDFEYISEDDVKVSINGLEEFGFSFVDAATIKLDNALTEPADITVYRNTFLQHRAVDFVNAAELSERDLDDSANQVFYAMQEAYDLARDSVKPEPDGSFSMIDRRLKDLAYPQVNTDAANRQYVDDQYGINSDLRDSISQDKDAAAASAQSSADSALAALNAETNVNILEDETQVAKNAAVSARDVASNQSQNAITAATEAYNYTAQVESRVSDAESARDDAQTAKAQAENAETGAAGFEAKAHEWAEKTPGQTVESSGTYSAKHWAYEAIDWATKAEDSPVAPGQYSALHWARKAEADRVLTGTLKDTVVSSATQVEQDRTTAADASAAAVNAASNAEFYEGSAQNAKIDTEASRDAAQGSATSASDSATSAQGSASAAATSEGNASNSETNSAAHEAKSMEWASKPGGQEVEPGLYSSRHYAEQAQAAVNGARIYISQYDASGGTLPIPSPQIEDKGKYWVISVPGTLPQVGFVDVGEELIVNDDLIYGTVPIPQVYLRRGDNLSDVNSTSAARSNLGVGSAGTKNVGTGSDNVPTRSLADGLYLGLNSNAVSASKWATSIQLSLSGDLNGSASFDGSGNVTLNATVGNDSHNHTIGNVSGLQAALDSKVGTTATAYDSARLSGVEASSYARTDTTETFNGAVHFTNNVTFNTVGRTFTFEADENGRALFDVFANGTRIWMVRTETNDDLNFERSSGSGELKVNNNLIWHAGNFNPSSKADTSHGHSISNISGLQTALNGKADSSHSHEIAAISGLQNALDDKTPVGHGHAISDITNLQSTLNGKLGTGAKAADSDKLNGLTAGNFIRANADDTVGGHTTWPNTKSVRFGDDADMRIFHDNYNNRIELNKGDLTIRNGIYPKFTFERVSGNFTANGSITEYSDERVKDDFKVIDGALDRVDQLTGFTYERTDVETDRKTGLIAQEVLKVLPEAVKYNAETDRYSLAYGNMMGLMVEAIKELKQEVEALKQKQGE